MINQIQGSRIQLCSRCIHTEITGWLDDNWTTIGEEIKKLILQELRLIKLKSGQCIVCKNSLVADDTIEKINQIINNSKITEQLKKEFSHFFCGD